MKVLPRGEAPEPRIAEGHGRAARYDPIRWFRIGVACTALPAVARWYFADSWSLGLLDVEYLEQTQRNNDTIKSDPSLPEPWNKITPSKDLIFHPCFQHHQCARLSVPMDWNSTLTTGPRVNLAVIKRPARVPVTDPRYGGLLWLQTGGPGSSGVDFLLNQGKTVQMIVDSGVDPSGDEGHDRSKPPKYFDVLGFDPRGVNNTTPRISCFPDSVARDAWRLQQRAEGVFGSSENAFAKSWARTNALSEGCSKRIVDSDDPEDKLAFHMNTSPVVADMIEIIEQYGKWREDEAIRLVANEGIVREEADHESIPIYPPPADAPMETVQVLERTKWRPGEEKLMYWGLSYGTILGATFAAMQPHRIERAIIDGVGDAPDYYRGEWRTNLQDADLILDKFSEYCDKAGPDACELYTEGGTAETKRNFKDVVDSLKGNPIGVPAQGSLAPDLITYSDVKSTIFTALYAPVEYFPPLAKLLSDLSHRNGTSFAIFKQAGSPIHLLTEQCRKAPAYAQECRIPDNTVGEISNAILCTDGNSTHGMSRAAFAEYVEDLRQQSWLNGDSWARIRLGCVTWSIKPKWRFPGPFEGKTAKPMLIVGNMLDPVTPIRNAHTMASRFPGSRVLELDAEGHCIMASPSLCMARHLRNYFQSGELPKPGMICDDNEKPFLGVTKRGSAEEEELLEQLRWTASHLFTLQS